MDAKVDFDGEKPLLMILRQKYPKLAPFLLLDRPSVQF